MPKDVECVVPVISVVAVYIARYWLDVSRPVLCSRQHSSQIMWRESDEIQLYCGLHEEEPAVNHLLRELRHSQICGGVELSATWRGTQNYFSRPCGSKK